MSEFLISLFGRFMVHHQNEIVPDLQQQKIQEALTYLIIKRQRPQTREQIAGVLWEDSSAAQGRKYLRHALWQLQTAISADFLLIDGEYIQFRPDAPVDIDIVIFEDTFLLSRGISGAELDDSAMTALDRVVNLYQGDLLEGWYQDWCIIERERLQNIYLMILDKLMSYCEVHRLYERGLLYGDCSLNCDPARERSHRRLMRLRYLAGDRTGALRQYERCREFLNTELNVMPSAFTEKLCQDIRSDNLDGVMTHFRDTIQPAALAAPFPEQPQTLLNLLARLDAVQNHLAQARAQCQQDIDAIHSALSQS